MSGDQGYTYLDSAGFRRPVLLSGDTNGETYWLQRLYSVHADPFTRPRTIGHLTPMYIKQICSINRVAIIPSVSPAGEVIAVAMLCPKPLLKGMCGTIEDVIVHKDHRRHGLARILVNYLIDHARQHGYRQLDLTNRPDRGNANLYLSLGFKLREPETNVYRLELP